MPSKSKNISYTIEELMKMDTDSCTIDNNFVLRVPRFLLKKCPLKDCYLKDFENIDQKKSNEKSKARAKKIPDEIIIAELSGDDDDDVGDDEEKHSPEHSRHCCIHNSRKIKISFDDLLRYKSRPTQPKYQAHENAVINPHHVVDIDKIEEMAGDCRSGEIVIARDPSYTRPANPVEHSELAHSAFERIVNKIKEKGLIPKSGDAYPNENVSAHVHCPVHGNGVCSKTNEHNFGHTADQSSSALNMLPSVLRRKLAALSEPNVCKNVSNELHRQPFEAVTASIEPADLLTASTNSHSSIGEKMLVPSGTLKSIILAKQGQQTCEQRSQYTSCSTARPANSYNIVNGVTDLEELERNIFGTNPTTYSYQNPSKPNYSTMSITGSSTTPNKGPESAHVSNDEDNRMFKSLLKEALNRSTTCGGGESITQTNFPTQNNN